MKTIPIGPTVAASRIIYVITPSPLLHAVYENNFLSFLENYNMITEDFLMSQEKEAKAEMCFGQGNFASSRKYFKESISLMKESRASAENCAHLYLRLGDVYLKLNMRKK